MKPTHAFLIALSIGILTADAQSHTFRASAAIGDRATIADDVIVEPLRLGAARACPSGTNCPASAATVLRANIYAQDRVQPVTLALGAPQKVAGGMLELSRVQPTPQGASFSFDYRPLS